jgi:integrase
MRLSPNEERIFPTTYNTIKFSFHTTRKRLAMKLGNERLLLTHIHTFRHWFAMWHLRKWHDVIKTQRALGHKRLENTEKYVRLAEDSGKIDYETRTAETIEEAVRLLDAGFDYITEIDGVKLFRKAK